MRQRVRHPPQIGDRRPIHRSLDLRRLPCPAAPPDRLYERDVATLAGSGKTLVRLSRTVNDCPDLRGVGGLKHGMDDQAGGAQRLGRVETIEVGRLERRVVGLTADEVGLTLTEGKDLLSELQRLVLQTQMEEYVMCARVCRDCLTVRRQRDCRTRTL